MNNHPTNKEMMETLLENCNDEVTKNFLIKWSYQMNRRDLFALYRKYIKTKEYYKYSKEVTARVKLNGKVMLDLTGISFNFFVI